MGNVKWIKLSTSMFDDEKIKLIEQMPDADTILVIWMKLLVQAGKTNSSGYIFLNESIPFTEEMLSTIFDRPLSTVRLALKTFEDLGMIGIDDSSFISITNWEKHQNIEGLERIRKQNRLRKRRQRERDKTRRLLSSGESICAYCGVKESDVGLLHTDHISPISKGGGGSEENLIKSCKSCNSSKSNKPLHVFLNDHIDHPVNPINVELVKGNKQLSSLIEYKGGKFLPVTKMSRDSHATDIEVDIDIDIDKDNIYTLFDYWIEKDIIKHRSMNQQMKSHINARLKDYSVDELKKAIDNYSTVVNSDDYFFDYKWTLQDFMKPRNVSRFVDDAEPLDNFRKDNKNSNGNRKVARF